MKTRRGSFSIRLFSLLRRAEVGGRVRAFTATASRNERNLRETTNADCSELSFLRLSLALLIIGVFWMVVQLHAYVVCLLIRLTPKSTRFSDDFVGTLAHWMLAGLSPLHFGCCHEPAYSPSYVGATACPLIPSNARNALNG